MILVLSLVLALVPLAGVVWMFASGMISIAPPSATVDGLFMSLILLTVSACFLLNSYWEARDKGLLAFAHKKKTALVPATAPPLAKTASATPAAANPAPAPKVPAEKVSS
ncbi:MAG: hypothetical protein ACJ72H_30580 [Candidatus Sulfotelmatobacter sp.]